MRMRQFDLRTSANPSNVQPRATVVGTIDNNRFICLYISEEGLVLKDFVYQSLFVWRERIGKL